MLQVGEWLILHSHKQSLPRTTEAKLGSLLLADHQQQEMPPKDLAVQLAEELGPASPYT
jgi:hypothetical protein